MINHYISPLRIFGPWEECRLPFWLQAPEWHWQLSDWQDWGSRRRVLFLGYWDPHTTRQSSPWKWIILSYGFVTFDVSPLSLSIFVNDILAEVEVWWNIPFETFNNIFIIEVIPALCIPKIKLFKKRKRSQACTYVLLWKNLTAEQHGGSTGLETRLGRLSLCNTSFLMVILSCN